MPSLIELVERVNRGESVEADTLAPYQESANSAEKFLAHHAAANLGLRRSQQHILQALEAIDYADEKVLRQFLSVSGFLNMTDVKCGPVVKFGASAIGRGESGMGVEAIQSGLREDEIAGGTWQCDRANIAGVGLQYDRAAEQIGWSPEGGSCGPWNNKDVRIAYVTSQIADDEPTTRTNVAFAKHIDAKRFSLFSYSTEAFVRRESSDFAQPGHLAPSERRGTKAFDALQRRKSATWVAPTTGSAIDGAKALADKLIEDQVDVIVFDCAPSDPIAALVSDWDTARVKVNLIRQTPLHTGGISGCLYLDQSKWEADKGYWGERGIDSRWSLEGIEPQPTGTAPKRSGYGIPESAVVLATAMNNPRHLSEPFVETVIDILRSHPHAVYLLIGEGDLAWQKRRFEAAGVAKRVGYTGRRKDMPGFLRIADIYLAEFPAGSPQGVLQAMSVDRPVVAALWGEGAEESAAGQFVGSEAMIGGQDPHAYLERVSKLIRDVGYRTKLGKSLAERATKHYSFAETARSIERMCDELIQQAAERGESADIEITPEPAQTAEAA